MDIHNFDIAALVGMLLLFAWNVSQQIVIQGIKKHNERQLFIHRLQFEKEFDIYKDVWAKIIDMRQSVKVLRPVFDTIPHDMTPEEVWRERINIAIQKSNDVILTTERNKPFYEKHIYDSLAELNMTTKKEIITVQHKEAFMADVKRRMNYWDEGERAIKEIERLCDNVCEAIRNRIQNGANS